MNRKKRILRHIKKDGRGIEIGPSHNPVAPKSAGFQVHVIDHASREQLTTKYKDHDVDMNKIEDVDFIWQGESYAELTGNTNYYDWIIASHVIEHTPNMIGFLNDCDEILKETGTISLIIPDKRYCFDHFRPITGISRIIDSHFKKSTTHSPGTIAEYYLNVVSKSGIIAWDSCATGDFSFVHTLEHARQRMKSAENRNAYLDVHAWCFVPHSFRLMIHDLFQLGLIPFKEIAFHQTDGFEFYMTLGRGGQGCNKTRMEMLETIESEIATKQQNVAFSAKLKCLIKRLIKRII